MSTHADLIENSEGVLPRLPHIAIGKPMGTAWQSHLRRSKLLTLGNLSARGQTLRAHLISAANRGFSGGLKKGTVYFLNH
jgi:hypothetical protein